jgi:DDE domain
MSNGSWRVDETYVKVKGRWVYLYRAVDSRGQTIDFLLSAKRDAEAVKRFFRKALAQPHTVSPRTITEACQYPLPVGHGQTQIGDIVETIRSVDRHDVGKRLVPVRFDLHQPHNPSHASTPGQITDAEYRSGTRTPKLAAVPVEAP